MRPAPFPWIVLNQRSWFGFVIVGAMTGALFLVREQLNTSTIALLYLLPVGLSTTLWGLGAGVLASLVAFLAFNYFFISPYYSLSVHQAQDILALAVFVGVAIFVSQTVGRAKASLAVAQAREQEALQLYELSTLLAHLRSREQITQALAERLHQAMRAAWTEITIEADSGEPGFTVRLPPDAPAPITAPQLVVPLLTGRGDAGEVRLWRPEPPLSAGDKRLLFTFASQGALALERVFLEQADTRTRILEESDRLKSALLSSVSHELRTPLASINAAVTSLRSGEVDWATPARADLLAMVEEEVSHLNRLVGNLLDMSRIEAGALRPQRQWNMLADIVSGTLNRLRRVSERHRIVVEVPDDLPLVPVDHVLLDQVLINLIGNSLKYAPAGSTVSISACPENERHLRVQVRNQGPHVPPEHLEHIFDKFYRVTAADRVTGTGLGLSICKGIVEAHGGRIWAENLPDGFALNFTLPIVWDGHPPPQLPLEADL